MNNNLPSGIAGARTKNVRAEFYAAVAFKPTDTLFKLLRPINPDTDPDGNERANQLATITGLLVDMDASYATGDNSEAIAGLMALAADKKVEPTIDAAQKQPETDEEKAARKLVQEAENKKRKAAFALYRKLKRHELRKANDQRFPSSAAMRALAASQDKSGFMRKIEASRYAAEQKKRQEAHDARQQRIFKARPPLNRLLLTL